VDSVVIESNFLTVTTNNYDAYGIHLLADVDVFAIMAANDMTGGIIGNTAYGAYLHSRTFRIGDPFTPEPVLFVSNTGTIDGVSERYMLYLETGSPGFVNAAEWGGNTFTPTGGDGTWDGNYDAGESPPQTQTDQDQPVWTNFGTSDWLNP
jgi:hypothetical protein